MFIPYLAQNGCVVGDEAACNRFGQSNITESCVCVCVCPKLHSVTKTQTAPYSVRGGHEIILDQKGGVSRCDTKWPTRERIWYEIAFVRQTLAVWGVELCPSWGASTTLSKGACVHDLLLPGLQCILQRLCFIEDRKLLNRTKYCRCNNEWKSWRWRKLLKQKSYCCSFDAPGISSLLCITSGNTLTVCV